MLRRVVPWLLTVLTGVVIGILLLGIVTFTPLGRRLWPRLPPEAQGPAAGVRITPGPGSTPGAAAPTPDAALTLDEYAVARRLAAQGRLREAQDAYLVLLSRYPGDAQALRGLVAVRRRLARDDPALLRRQANAYAEAAAQGVETEEHYTADIMRVLVRATLLAAEEVERERGIQVQPALPPPASTPRIRTTRPPRPTPRATPRRSRERPTPQPTVGPVAPTAPGAAPPTASPPAPSPSARPTPAPADSPASPLNVNEPFFVVQVGPVSDADRASAIAGELTVAGYGARISRVADGSGYLITLGPYRQSAVEAIRRFVTARFGPVPITVTPAP